MSTETVINLLQQQSTQTPDKILYTFVDDAGRDQEQLTSQQLAQSATAIATTLVHQQGFQRGDRVLLSYPQSLDFIKALVGCMTAGIIPVPVYPPNPLNPGRSMALFATLAERSGARAILTNGDYNRLRHISTVKELFTRNKSNWPQLPWIRTDQIAAENRSNSTPLLALDPPIAPDDIAFLQFTSGSTSVPKGVAITYANIEHQLTAVAQTLDMGAESEGMLWVPQYHDLGLINGIFNAIFVGGHLTLMSPLTFIKRPHLWFEVMDRVRATHTAAPNFAYDLAVRKTTAAQRRKWDLSSLKIMMLAAEPVQPTTIERFFTAFAESGVRREACCPGYGMAEHTVAIAVYGQKMVTFDRRALERERIVRPLDDAAPLAAQKGSNGIQLIGCGRPINGVRVRIVNPESCERCQAHEVGEIWIDSPSKAAGYDGLPEQTAASFHATIVGEDDPTGYLRTGDLGFFYEDELFVVGRLKDLIIIRGRNIYPQDIEETIRDCHPLIRPGGVVAFAVPMADRDANNIADHGAENSEDTSKDTSSAEQEELVVLIEVTNERLTADERQSLIDTVQQLVSVDHQLRCAAVLLGRKGAVLKTTSGKVQRSACRLTYLDGSLAPQIVHEAVTMADIIAPSVEDEPQALETQKQQTALESGQTTPHAKPISPAIPAVDKVSTVHTTDNNSVDHLRQDEIVHWMLNWLDQALPGSAQVIDPARPFADLGLNSVQSIEFAQALEEWLALPEPLDVTIVWRYSTIDALAMYLATPAGSHTIAGNPGLHDAPQVTSRHAASPIAIVGMGCRFPGGAIDPATYWQLLHDGFDAITEVPPARWDTEAYYDPRPNQPGKLYTRHGGFIDDIEQFDALFFGITPREADNMDPQQRLLLEVSWEALEAAGIAATTLAGSQTGAFVGLSSDDFAHQRLKTDIEGFIDEYAGLGANRGVAVGRLAYNLGIQGPVMQVDTTCSSSLLAVHLACQSLRAGECELALAGGVNLMLTPDITIGLANLNALAPDGHCKTFDAAADGYIRSEGCGMVVLKRLDDALRDHDPIVAVIRGSAVNHDGRSNGLTAPNGTAQEAVIRQALVNASVSPSELQYVETHGTGTPLGDPIELIALGNVLCHGRAAEEPLYVGSVKTNVGHLEAAAGIASLQKVALALQQQAIPPHLHFSTPNPHIPWATLPVAVPTQPVAWAAPDKQPTSRRIAGISSFGISGTNVHLIVEEAPNFNDRSVEERSDRDEHTEVERTRHLLTLSAKSTSALTQLAERYQAYLWANPASDLGDICYTANSGRSHFDHRLAVTGASQQEMRQHLASYLAGQSTPHLQQGSVQDRQTSPKVAFLFTGQGSQYVGMGRELYATEPTFRATIERCDVVLQECLGRSLIELLYPTTLPDHDDLMTSHPCGQAANFALECALVDLWRSWGISADIVLGHSLGEFAAVYAAGVLSLEDGLRLVVERGRLMEKAMGRMVAVEASEERVAPLLQTVDDVTIAVVNGPESVVISGGHESVVHVAEQLQAAGMKTRTLAIPVAAHSPMLDPVLDAFEAVVERITLSAPRIPVVSSMTGKLVTDELTTPRYWRNHLRNTVRFAAGVTTLHEQGADIYLEVGPQPTLLGLAHPLLDQMSKATAYASRSSSSGMAHPQANAPVTLASLWEGRSDWRQLLESLGTLYVHGVTVNWSGFDHNYVRRKVVLPTYPFQRRRHWPQSLQEPRRESTLRSRGASLRVLIDKMIKSPILNATIFETELSCQSLPFLTDHRINEQVVVPGAGYLALVLSAAELAYGDQPRRIEQVVFPQALIIPEDETRIVQLVLTPVSANGSGPHDTFQLIAIDPTINQIAVNAPVATHASGQVAQYTGDVGRGFVGRGFDVATTRQQCPEEVSVARFYKTAADHGLELGPSFRWVTALWRSQSAENGNNGAMALGKFQVPEVLGNTTGYLLHPGLLDACFQMAAVARADSGKTELLVPFALGELRLYRAVTGTEWWCRAQQVDTLKWDICLQGGDGEVVADIIGFEMRAVSPSLFQSTRLREDWLYEIAWQEQALVSDLSSLDPAIGVDGESVAAQPTAWWLVFGAAQGLGQQVVEQLQRQGKGTLLVTMGDGYRVLRTDENGQPQQVAVDPTVPEDFQRLVADFTGYGQPCTGVIYLWGAEAMTPETTDILTATTQLSGGLLHLVQALLNAQLAPPLWLVTENLALFNTDQAATDQSASITQNAGQRAGRVLWGLGRTIVLEHPQMTCTLIDLGEGSSADHASTISIELEARDGEPQIAYQQGVRHVARLARRQVADDANRKEQFTIHTDASYLITGGLGALGLQMALQLVEEGARHLVLAGRRGVTSEEAQQVIAQLEENGVTVQAVQADIAQQDDVVRLLDESQRHAPLRGIIHAAGVLDDGLLAEQSLARFERVMAPKVAGTWHLHTLTRALPLDFFVCFSSAASLLGSPGQSNYAAANGFMDALMVERQRLGLPGLSINWGPWAEVGLAAALQSRMAAQGMDAIAPLQGRHLFKLLYRQDSTQVAVLPINWRRFSAQVAHRQGVAFYSAFLQSDRPSSSGTAIRSTLLAQLVAVSPEERTRLLAEQLQAHNAEASHAKIVEALAQIWADALGLEHVAVNQDFFALGGNSLLATKIIGQIKDLFQIEIPAQILFEKPTISGLATYLHTVLWISDDDWANDNGATDTEVIEL